MPKLSDYGLTIETEGKRRWLKRGSSAVPIGSLQRDMLEWLDGTVTPSIERCCRDLYETVDPEWLRGQWEKLAAMMRVLGVAPLIDEAEMIALHHVDEDGCPMAPVQEPQTAEMPVFQSGDGEPSDDTDRRLWLEQRLNAAEAKAEKLRAEIAEYREAARGQLVIVNQAKEALAENDALRMRVTALETELVKIRDMNDALGRENHALRDARPSAEVNRLWDGPVRIAPRYLNVPVSEPLFRWLESAGDRNRRSADDMARALFVAFMRSTGNREAA